MISQKTVKELKTFLSEKNEKSHDQKWWDIYNSIECRSLREAMRENEFDEIRLTDIKFLTKRANEISTGLNEWDKS